MYIIISPIISPDGSHHAAHGTGSWKKCDVHKCGRVRLPGVKGTIAEPCHHFLVIIVQMMSKAGSECCKGVEMVWVGTVVA